MEWRKLYSESISIEQYLSDQLRSIEKDQSFSEPEFANIE